MTEPWQLGREITPFGGDSTYQVFRSVKDPRCGAKGDGVTDDTAAINLAISDGNRCGSGCNSSTMKGALLYFPAGTYLVSGSIISYYNTQLVGNPNSIPTLKASATFVGLGVIDTDYYIPGGNGAKWYINQESIYRQIRNFNIDISATTAYAVCGIHYQVAQATSLYNIGFIQSSAAGTTQQGICKNALSVCVMGGM
jgi:glucan 1,3-beta-glucosidase